MITTLEGKHKAFKKFSTTSVTKKFRVWAKNYGLPTDQKHTFYFLFFALAGQKYKQTNGQMAMQTLDGLENMYL